MATQTHWEAEVHMPFWTKEKEAGVWDFKGKASNSQVEEKEQTHGKRNPAGLSETAGHREGPTNWLCRVSAGPHTQFIS